MTSSYYKLSERRRRERERSGISQKADQLTREEETVADITVMRQIEGELWTRLFKQAPRVVAATLGPDAYRAVLKRKSQRKRIAYLLREDAWRTWLRACVASVRIPGAAEKLQEAQRLRNRCVERNMPLVLYFAKKAGEHGIIKTDDVINEGAIGLIRGTEAFDPTRGFAFGTYVIWWVRHRIIRCLQEYSHTVRIPIVMGSLYARQEKVRQELAGQLGRQPTDAELASRCCLTEYKLDEVRRAGRVRMTLPLDRPQLGAANGEPSDAVSRVADPTALAVYDRAEAHSMISLGVSRVQDMRQRIILEQRLRGETLEAIGDKLHITRERVRQLEVKARRALAFALHAHEHRT